MMLNSHSKVSIPFFFLLYAAWVRSRAERPSVSYTKVVMEVAWTGHNLHIQRRINQQNGGINKFRNRGGREDETDARAEHQTHWRGASDEWMKESKKMQCRASNPLARRIKGWSPKTCYGRPARKTRRTEVMKMKGEGGKHQQKTGKAVRRLKCKVPGCRAKAIQIRDLVKSRMPEIVEPKQLIQSRVLVKRARLTVKRGAARPNGKPKPPQSPLRRAVRYRIRGAARHSTQDHQRGGRERGTENEGSAS